MGVDSQPETRYARSGEVNIAYPVAGDGPFDLVLVPGYVTHLERGGGRQGRRYRRAHRCTGRGDCPGGEVVVSSIVKDLVAGSGVAFEDRGVHELKGIPGEWRLFGVSSGLV